MLRYQRLHKMRAAAAVVTIALLAAACSSGGGDDELGVAVKDVATDVGLGIEEEAADTAPANTFVDRPVRRDNVPKKPKSFTSPIEEVPSTGVDPVIPTCPAAGPLESPDHVDPTAISEQRPKEGSYLWFADATIQTDEGPVTISDFPEGRSIFNVREDPSVDGAFLFDMSQIILLSADLSALAVQLTTFLVLTESPAEGFDIDRDDAEGVYIQQIITLEIRDEEFTFRGFTPKPPVLILPFPVEPGAEIDSTGVDDDGQQPPVPGQVPDPPDPEDDRVYRLTVRGEVTGRDEVDACGDEVQTWHVDGEKEFQIVNPNTGDSITTLSDWDYDIALHYGGMLMREHIRTPMAITKGAVTEEFDTPFLDLNTHIGQLEPTVRSDEEDGEG